MRKRRMILVLAVAVILALLVSGCARWRYRSPAERAEGMVEHLAGELDLNQAQRLQLEKIKDEVLAKQAEMQVHRAESFDEVIGLMQAERIDEDRFKLMAANHQAKAYQLITFFGDKLQEFHAMLTPAQRARVVAIMQDYRAHLDRRCGRY